MSLVTRYFGDRSAAAVSGGMTACKLHGATGNRADVVISYPSGFAGALRAENILQTLEAQDLTVSTGVTSVIYTGMYKHSSAIVSRYI